jgi:hypothetical protein
MDKSVVVAIIAGVFSLLSVWFTHHLAAKRRPRQRRTTIVLKLPKGSVHLSDPALRRQRLKRWCRALIAIALCPMVDAIVQIWISIVLRSTPFYSFWADIGPTLAERGPWLYVASIIIMLPLLTFLYGEFPEKKLRLILSVLSWSLLSAVYFTVYAIHIDLQLDPHAWHFWAFVTAGIIGGAIAGLLYWTVTYTRSPRVNSTGGQRLSPRAS